MSTERPPPVLTNIANETELMSHLDARFENALDERALGGFALLLVRMVGISSADAIGACIQETLRDTDFVAMIDDAHYAIVIPQVSDVPTAALVAGKLRAALLPALVRGIAIGGALFPQHAKSRDLLLDAATEKLREAATAGQIAI